MRIFCWAFIVLVANAGSAGALTIEHPPKGSTLRAAVLDAIRPAVEVQLDPEVEFVVTYIGVEGGWAFVRAEPHRAGGGKISAKRYFPTDWRHMDGVTVTAVLRLVDHRWKTQELQIGSTDAWYCSVTRVALIAPCGLRESLKEARLKKYAQLCEDTKYYTHEERISQIALLAYTHRITEPEAVEAADVCEELYPKPGASVAN